MLLDKWIVCHESSFTDLTPYSSWGLLNSLSDIPRSSQSGYLNKNQQIECYFVSPSKVAPAQ